VGQFELTHYQEQRRIANDAKNRSIVNPQFGNLLFPDGPPLAQRWTIPITAENVEKRASRGGFYGIDVILAVGYRSTLDRTAAHCITAVYELHRIDPAAPGVTYAFVRGEAVAFDRLSLEQSPFIAPIAE
jgi:hypothetical protein